LPDRLNLGCGTDIRAGYVNLDSAALPGVDVVHDIGERPLPFDAESFDEILCKDVLEHVELVPTMRELHRILRPGGRLRVIAPHFTSAAAWVDPTHRTAFSVETFGFFARSGAKFARSYYFDFVFERMESARIVFHRYRWQPWNYALEPLINSDVRVQRYFEQTGLSRLFPAANVDLTLIR
jgi:SAM-dependent methyltransferase